MFTLAIMACFFAAGSPTAKGLPGSVQCGVVSDMENKYSNPQACWMNSDLIIAKLPDRFNLPKLQITVDCLSDSEIKGGVSGYMKMKHFPVKVDG